MRTMAALASVDISAVSTVAALWQQWQHCGSVFSVLPLSKPLIYLGSGEVWQQWQHIITILYIRLHTGIYRYIVRTYPILYGLYIFIFFCKIKKTLPLLPLMDESQ